MPIPLAPLCAAGVAEWMDVFGFAIPVTWGDPAAEHDAIGNPVPVIEFSVLLKYDATGPGVLLRECRAGLALIALQGPKSRALLQGLAKADLSNAGLPCYSVCTGVKIAGIPMQISRLGFTGELGYELLLPLAKTPMLWQALTTAGAAHGLRRQGGPP